MALHTIKQFATLCGIKDSSVRTYITRSKVIKSGDYIDDSIYPNNAFLEKCRAESGADIKVPPAPHAPKERELTYSKPEYPEPDAPNIGDPEFSGHKTLQELDRIKKSLDIEKTTEEVKKLRITIEKLEGEVIPTDLVKMILIQQSKAAVTAFKNACDNVLDEFASKSKMSNEERSRIRGRITAETNLAIDEAVKLAKKETKHIADEYSLKRGKGERK